ncbi:MAG: histidinol dehydrogenase [Candidatus Scalindua sp. AMX11]|nr:MAG: histidinol dehydrogenase [Candidatus Scalindua sp.]NOG82852.1 histidinol dehydrogenase [Planctomycetota bacterium]RZV86266.1 MAG: histidinol dehydrogenase [Candidatus Scalindua sp. SCAELEC01]TDE65888.1 MAG: histidinol dehydrogenase [Candidatus Scalindua sp. AMX11]
MSLFADILSVKMAEKTKEVFGKALTPMESVKRIISDVREKGDSAIAHYSDKFEGVSLSANDFRVKEEEIEEAYEKVSVDFLRAIRNARENIKVFQEHIRVREPEPFSSKGTRITVTYDPIENVGLYIPGGSASYPSTVLMNAIPAKVAGVKNISVVSPPGRDGSLSPERLVACRESEVDEIYKIGGVHSIAALAFGTETVGKVDKIVGPGNIYVTLAKKEVFGHVGIDILAGPSEVLIIADDSANVAFIAADLLSQAEHAPGISILVTDSERFASDVLRETGRQLLNMPGSDSIQESLDKFGFIIITKDLEEAIAVSNTLAPEHLQIVTQNDERVLLGIKHAGAIFLGPYSPVAVGDYIAGPSHVLPTGSTARFFSGLSVNDFLKRTSIMTNSRHDLEMLADDIITISEAEGLVAHAKSVRVRVEK